MTLSLGVRRVLHFFRVDVCVLLRRKGLYKADKVFQGNAQPRKKNINQAVWSAVLLILRTARSSATAMPACDANSKALFQLYFQYSCDRLWRVILQVMPWIVLLR